MSNFFKVKVSFLTGVGDGAPTQKSFLIKETETPEFKTLIEF